MIVHGLLRINIISQLYLSRSLPLSDSISVMPIANEPHRGRERGWARLRFHSIVCIFFLFPSLLRLLFSFHTLKIHCNLWWYGVGCVCVRRMCICGCATATDLFIFRLIYVILQKSPLSLPTTYISICIYCSLAVAVAVQFESCWNWHCAWNSELRIDENGFSQWEIASAPVRVDFQFQHTPYECKRAKYK